MELPAFLFLAGQVAHGEAFRRHLLVPGGEGSHGVFGQLDAEGIGAGSVIEDGSMQEGDNVCLVGLLPASLQVIEGDPVYGDGVFAGLAELGGGDGAEVKLFA